MKIIDLEGKWKIHREVYNRHGKVKNQMEGLGIFLQIHKEELLYQEQVFNETKEEKVFFATKFYRYVFDKKSVHIFFHKEESNRLFLTLPCLKKMEGSSMCKDDSYTLNWEWMNPKQFLMRYSVVGPYKDYIIKSRFIKR